MNGHKNGGANKNRISRTIKVSPTTRAIRSAIAASATLLALTGASTAMAGTCFLTSPTTYLCTGAFTNSVEIEGTIPPVFPDLTVVIGLSTGGTTVNPAAGVTGISGSWGGNVGIVNYSDMNTDGADGVFLYGSDTATFANHGNINTTVQASGNNAVDISGLNGVTFDNYGSLVAVAPGAANSIAVDVYSQSGGVDFDNAAGGIIIAGATSGSATGVLVDVYNGGTVVNNGDILASSYSGTAIGIQAFSVQGDITVENNGNLDAVTSAIAGGTSTGIDVFSGAGNVFVNTGIDAVTTVGGFATATGISAVSWFGDVTVDAQGDMSVTSYAAEATGIYAYGKYADVTNGGALTVAAYGGNAIGIEAYGVNGTSVTNTGDLTVFTSTPGAYAAGVIASGSGNITVNNSGNINVTSAGDGSGMGLLPYAEGADGVGLSAISIYSGGGEGQPALLYGANDVNSINSLNINVNVGGNGTGMNAVAIGAGNAYLNNSGTVTVNAGGYATGMNGFVDGAGAYIVAYNTGTVTANAGFDAYGMHLIAVDGTVTVHNDGGSVNATGYYFAGGIVINGYDGAYVSGDGGAQATAGGLGADSFNAIGINAYSYNGNANAESGGYVMADSYGVSMFGGIYAIGLAAQSNNGNANAGTTGSVHVEAGGEGYGIQAIGAVAYTVDGDASITNGVGSSIDVTASGYGSKYGPDATGAIAMSANGNVDIHAYGSINATATNDSTQYNKYGAQAYGLVGLAQNGDVTIYAGGSISATANTSYDNYYGGYATGILAGSSVGDVYVNSAADINATLTGGTSAGKYTGGATGINAYSTDGDVTINVTMGAITVHTDAVDSGANSLGINAFTENGDISITTAGDITAVSDNVAQGIYSYNKYGATSITNAAGGDITATSNYSSATGIYGYSKYGTSVTVTNDGNITADGYDFGNGIVATIYEGGYATVNNSGDITASGFYGATGISANTKYSLDGDITIGNAASGDITVTSTYQAVGIQATTKYGNTGTISVTNDGNITATATGEYYIDGFNNLYVYGTAAGIIAQGYYVVDVTNSGNITANGYYGGIGILAASYYDDVTVTNNVGATIDVFAGGSYFYAPYAYGIAAVNLDGDNYVTNDGHVYVEAYADSNTLLGNAAATGILANTYNGTNTVSNSGIVDVYAHSNSIFYGPSATGISTYTVNGDTHISNTGSIAAEAYSYWYADFGAPTATGVSAISLFGDQDLYNDGSISAEARAWYDGASATGVYLIGYFDQSVTTTAGSSISATATGGDDSEYALSDATGIAAFSLLFDGVTVYNEGSVSATASTGLDNAYSSAVATGIAAEAIYDGVYVTNTAGASVTAVAHAGYGEYGFDNQADAYGIVTYSYGGNIVVDNDGSVSATAASGGEAGYANATGVSALIGVGGYGNIDVNNGGQIHATAEDNATGVIAVSYAGYGFSVDVRNYAESGISAVASGGYDAVASGVVAVGYDVFASNAGSIYAHSFANYSSTSTGVGLYAYDDATFSGATSNSVTAHADGDDALATGIFAGGMDTGFVATDGQTTAIAHGAYTAYAAGVYALGGTYAGFRGYANHDVVATASAADNAGANGVVVDAADAHATNFGTITATAVADEAYSYGVYVYGLGHAWTYNDGSITANTTGGSSGWATGVYLYAEDSGFSNATGATVSGTGSSTSGIAVGHGASVTADGGTAWVYNEGAITGTAHAGGTGDGYATGLGMYGVWAEFYGAAGSSTNATATGYNAYAYGTLIHGDYSYFYAESAFNATAHAYGEFGTAWATGAYVYGYDHVEVETNSLASFHATATGYDANAVGLGVYGYNDVYVENWAPITAVATGETGHAAGLVVDGYWNGFHVENHGVINATFNGDGDSFGVILESDWGQVSMDNYANITATGGVVATGVYMEGNYWTSLDNFATITGTGADFNVAIGGGDSWNYIWNYGTVNGALWLGDGDDYFYNESGHVWNPGTTPTDMGDGDDHIYNYGIIHLDDSFIYMGQHRDDGNTFKNYGLITIEDYNLIHMGDGLQTLVPSLNPLPFVNDGVLDFLDGSTDDYLMIVGDFAGQGELWMDVTGLDHDSLYIDGSIVAGTVQTVYVDLHELPYSIQEEIPLVYVSGVSAEGEVVLGDVEWDDVNTFVTLDFDIVYHSGNPDIFALGITATGLTDAGTLAASVPGAVQSLMNSQVGTWRQRMGVIDKFTDGAVALWARVWQDKGGFSPDHHAANFGDGGNFDWDQDNSGVEAGVDFSVTDEISLGLLVGKSQADTHLTDPGTGKTEVDADTWGVYGTWISPTGFYLDLSYRWMSFDVDITSAIGSWEQDGDANSFNVEVGYAWTLAGGLKIEPQLQYTKTDVDELQAIETSTGMVFRTDGGESSRGRAGLAFRKSFGEADTGWMWTPYATISAIREFEGENEYSINNALFGDVDTGGTSTLLELGFTANHQNWAIYGGLNWQDGGAVESFFGGQLGVRYTFGAPAPAPAPVVAPPPKTCADLDDDGDGINNCDDKCLGTPAGEAVGPDGCPVPPAPEPVMEPKPYRG